jgi:polyisoprenyl-phosphate glycosyltransferase
MEHLEASEVEFSVIIPAYNEEQVLPRLFPLLMQNFNSWVQGAWEVIFIDDGSSDQTAFLIACQNATDPRFKAISLSRNFGHQAAVSTGLAYASGKFSGCMKPAGQASVMWPMALGKNAKYLSCST